MTARALEIDDVAFNTIDEYPVRLDMGIAKAAPLTLQRVVLIGGRQLRPLQNKGRQVPQFLQLLAATLSESNVALEVT